jgi:hypothetical protein
MPSIRWSVLFARVRERLRRPDYGAIDGRLRALEARLEARTADLRALQQEIAGLELPAAVPLRRPTLEALGELLPQADRAVRGELPDRRSGTPGRRASDWNLGGSS